MLWGFLLQLSYCAIMLLFKKNLAHLLNVGAVLQVNYDTFEESEIFFILSFSFLNENDFCKCYKL